MVTTVPTGPRVDLKLVNNGVTRNVLLLVNLTPDVVTVIKPVVAPLRTAAVQYVLDTTVGLAAVPLKDTAVFLETKPWPRISMICPTFPEYGSRLTQAA
jgi:hypothetical protein